MFQISNQVYCDNFLLDIPIENKLLPNCYKEYPFLLIKKFFSKQLTHKIVRTIKDDQNLELAKIKSLNNNGIVKKKLKQNYRKTNIYKLSQEFSSLYETRFNTLQPKIEEYFNVSLTLGTKIQVLEYKKGFFYKKHADDSNEIIDSNGETVGFHNVAPQRKITTVLFGSSNHSLDKEIDPYSFHGGELLFNYLYDKEGNNLKIKPQAGDMLVFPSNPYFSHEVAEVIAGYRLTLVQWHDAIIH